MAAADKAGILATEALMVTVAQRHLQSRYPGLVATRGDGNIRFDLGCTFANDKELVDVLERVCEAVLKEVVGRTRLRMDSCTLDFNGLRENVVTFMELMKVTGGAAASMLPDLSALPTHGGVARMLEMLYDDAVSGSKHQTCVSQFPPQLCGSGLRFDIAAAGRLIVQSYSARGEAGAAETASIILESKALAAIVAEESNAPVEQQLPQQWRQKTFSLEETEEMLQVVFQALKLYWNSSPRTEKARINAASLVGIVSGELRDYLREQILLESGDVTGPWRIQRTTLQRATSACNVWLTLRTALTSGGEWSGWDGGDCGDASFDDFVARVSAANRIRALIEHAGAVVSRQEMADVHPETIFEGLWLTDAKRTPQERWVAAVETFEKNFALLESTLIGRLRSQWQQQQDDPVRFAFEMVEVIERPGVAAALVTELAAVGSTLRQRVAEAVSRFETRDRGAATAFEKIEAARDGLAELAPVSHAAHRVLGSTEHVAGVAQDLDAATQRIADVRTAAVQQWGEQTAQQCTEIAAGAVVTLARREDDSDKEAPAYLAVTEAAPVTQLLHQVQVLASLHPEVFASLPAEATRTLGDLRSLTKLGMRMRQVAVMFNGLTRQVLPCTRPMLQDPIARCEAIAIPAGQHVRSFAVTAGNELEMVISKMQSSLDALAQDNRAVRKFHNELTSTVCALFSVDLLQSVDQWKAMVKDMVHRFEGFEKTRGLGKTGAWKRHWDYQLYKALEHQYRRGLESLNESVQPFKVELMFKQGGIHFKPGFEALREKYYEKIKKFVSFPNRFTGVGNSEFFAQMPARNAKGIAQVHTKAMELFQKLNRVRKQFRDHIVIGLCGMHGAWDLDVLVGECAQSVEQWQAGLKLVKERMSKVQSIEDKIVVECIEISTVPIKATIEDHVKKLEEALVNSLRRAAQARLTEVDEFVLFASNIIERHPTSLEEVGQANKAYLEFKEQLPAMEAKLQEQEELQKLLRSTAGVSIDMALTKSRWDHLMDAMASHQKQIDASVEKMRGSVDALIQKFLKDVQRFANHWNQHKPKDASSLQSKKEGEAGKKEDAGKNKGLSYVKDRVLEMEELVQTGADLEEKCTYFKVHPPDMSLLHETQADVKEHEAMWNFFEEFDTAVDVLRQEDWLTFRSKTYRFEDLLKEWTTKLETALPPECLVATHITASAAEWTDVLPLFKFVRGEGFLPEHWNEIFRMLDLEKGMTSDKLCFGHVLDKAHNIVKNEGELKQLHGRAQGEVQIRDALQELRAWSLDAEFTLVPPGEGTTQSQVMLITEWKDVLTQVSDYQALLSSLKDSQYYVRFADEAGLWEQKLLFVNECMLLLNDIQRRWVFLEPLFARGALPQEQPRFKRVDKEFVSILREVQADPRVMSLAQHTDYDEKLKAILEQIERCQKALNEFLEQKRDKFPRFYFISDEDLLEILGQSKNPAVIQSHLKKLFSGINTVRFNEEKTAIESVLSSDTELVPLIRAVSITAPDVEDWLIELDGTMRATLKDLLAKCTALPSCTSVDVVDTYPSQILQTAEQVLFTAGMEQAIPKASSGGFQAFKQKLDAKLDELTGMDLRGDKVRELKVKALIMDLIHSIEVVEQLASVNVSHLQDWHWQKQLRYYFDQGTQDCTVRMSNTKFFYTFEYQGNAAKLVHTPLTDRCYLTLTQGMHLGYGGNLYGPAGTGKTESVKALGGALGRQVLVFNCDEGIDFKAMGRIFVGIVKCGAWGCFDEFNRLKVDQLSAISQMIQVIQEALKLGEPNCTLLGRLIDVNAGSGIFVTLNPAGKGYGGRSKLPDNLKLLFRAVAMSVPNSGLITQTMLLSEGFRHAKGLAPKVVEVYRLSKQLLSPQQHYDWGLRPLKAVLRLGGSLVQQLRDGEASARTENAEAELMVQSLRVNTLSKLTFEDARLFNGIIGDIFPGVAVKDIKYDELDAAVRGAVEALGLQISETQLHKVMQLYEAMNQRTGVVLVGPSGSGKSTLLRILRKALQSLGTEVPQHAMNPKALPRKQLLGHMDVDTREWFDGVLSSAARTVVKQPLEVRSWIFCDGDIDPEWVESLNSVLDDNKLLTMPNGVRIQFGSNVNFVFETHSLQYASPATVSRMGIIFLSEEDVKPKYVVASHKMTDEQRDRAGKWIDSYLYKAIDLAVEKEAFTVTTTRMCLLNACLTHAVDARTKLDFAASVARALCGFMDVEVQADFANAVYGLVGERPAEAKAPLHTYVDRGSGDAKEIKAEAAKLKATDLIGSDVTPIVGTVEVQRTLHALRPLVETDKPKPFFLVGPEGCGKSLVLSHCFSSVKSCKVAVVNCSAQTASAQVIQKLQQMCSLYSTPQGKVLRPKEAERLVLVFKDINLPKPDKYGTVMLHSLLQQLLLYEGFYDNELEWVGVERVQIVGSMNAETSAGRFPVSPRLLAIVNIISIGYPETTSLMQVYTSFFGALLKMPGLADGRQFDGGRDLAQFTTTLYGKLKRRFNGEEYRHCVFSPRDITAWALSILRYDLKSTSIPEVLGYEASRLFSDRLPKLEDRSRAERLLTEQLASIGYAAKKEDRAVMAFSAVPNEWIAKTTESVQAGSRLLSLANVEQAQKRVEEAMLHYGREYGDLDVKLIPELLLWATRVERALCQPSGHVLLTGRAGVGRRALLTIVCYQLKIDLVRLHMGRDYGRKQFIADLKNVINRAGVQNERVCLLVEEHNVTEESYLEMLNSLIASGEVPGLFTNEEVDQMLSPLREEAAAEGGGMSVPQFLQHRLACNLRIAVMMDPQHPLFNVRCQSNPALLTRCTLLWMDTWSADGMKQLAGTYLKEVSKEIAATGDKLDVVKELIRIHDSMGDRVTPQLFANLMAGYESIYAHKKQASKDAVDRLATGLAKLIEAEETVDTIQRDVTKKKREMEIKQKEQDQAMNDIERNMSDAAEQRTKAEELSKMLDEEQVVIADKSEKVEHELSGIAPMLEQAKEAIGGIRSDNLSEIASLKMPPEAIRDVLEGVLGLLGQQDTSWQAMRKFLKSTGVKERIISFDSKTVTTKIRDSVNVILKQRANSFKPEVIGRASSAAAPMAAWVKANVEYATVLDRIEPLRAQLSELETNKAAGEEKLNKTQAKLKKIDEKLDKLKKDFAKLCKDAEKLKDSLEKAEKQLTQANSLLSELSGEKDRWSAQTNAIQEDARLMPRKALLCAGFMTYLGQESEDTRRSTLSRWAERLNISDNLDFASYMRSESQLLRYKSEGLPGDGLSMENAVVMLDVPMTPLVIDPANQAIAWLDAHLKAADTTVETLSISDERFAHSLELAIRFGKTLLVTEVDRIEPLLFPVLRRDLQSQGPKKVVQLGTKTVDWQETFRVYLFTRSTDLTLTPDAAALVNEVNFSVTRSGLESQLLGLTIQHEQPTMQQQKVELLQKEEALKMQLAELEESLLHDLANSHGNLLENQTLITSLKTIKEQSIVIEKSLKESHALQIDLDQQREVFRPLAHIGSILFFLVQDMEHINKMYRFALVVFLSLFQEALVDYKGPTDVAEKMKHLSVALCQKVFLYVSRGLFKDDRVPFAMHVVRGLHPERFPAKLWDVFNGRSAGTAEGVVVPRWCQAQVHAELMAVHAADPEALGRWSLDDDAKWSAWLKDHDAVTTLLKALKPMDALLFVSVFYRERLVPTMTRVALDELQLPALAEVTTIETLVPSTTPGMPILLITSAGADPSLEVQEVAHKIVGRDKFTQIALGGGQTDEALQQVRRCAISGEWCFLKNLHLVLDWVPVLEKEVCAMQNPHKDFRLWFTSEAHDAFPSVLLKSSLKMTIESPPGIQQNMLRTYGGWRADWLQEKTPVQAQLLFALSWFHAAVSERRGFIPQGWVKFYEFTPADLRAAADVVLEMPTSGTIDWTTLRGVFDDAIYGGRLDNDQDMAVLRLLLARVFSDATVGTKGSASASLYGRFMVPQGNTHADAVKAIHALPEMNLPDMFQLPGNADNVVLETLGARFRADLKTLASASTTGGHGGEAMRGMLEPLMAEDGVWAKSPIKGMAPPHPGGITGDDPDPVQVFLVSEQRMLAGLILEVQRIFDLAKHVVDGTALPTSDLARVAGALATFTTPDPWQDKMAGPDSLALWLVGLASKTTKTVEWAQQFATQGRTLLSAPMNLTERLRPHTFLNALRQYTARNAKVPLADLVLTAGLGAVPGATVGVTLAGASLQLQGGIFTSGSLRECDGDTPSSTPFGDIGVAWVQSTHVKKPGHGLASVPLYTSSTRELHVFNVLVPCEGSADDWTLRGAALFLAASSE